MRCSIGSLLVLATACGGGGGATTTTPVGAAARLAADNIVIGPAVYAGDILVRLASAPTTGPCLIEVAVELPPGLSLPATDRLQAATALPTLDGDFVGDRFIVMCGDAQSNQAGSLPVGPLFRLRVTPTPPRQLGTYTVRLFNLRGATREGESVPVATDPTTIEVVVQ